MPASFSMFSFFNKNLKLERLGEHLCSPLQPLNTRGLVGADLRVSARYLMAVGYGHMGCPQLKDWNSYRYQCVDH